MRQIISISLAFLIFFSFAGFVIPCTIHCIQHGTISFGNSTHTTSIHLNHGVDVTYVNDEHVEHSTKTFAGICFIQTDNQNSMSTHGSNTLLPIQFSQLISQLLTATFQHTGTYLLSTYYSTNISQTELFYGQWTPMPDIPPPRA